MLHILTLIFLCTCRKVLAEVGKLRYFAKKEYAGALMHQSQVTLTKLRVATTLFLAFSVVLHLMLLLLIYTHNSIYQPLDK
jgi:hypothetical protein